MNPCPCRETHTGKRIVLTGGPGAGKTAVLELIRLSFCKHVRVLPESAGILFSGGFPRAREGELLRSGQRAIFHVQHELERAAVAADGNAAVVLCDRGTVDGAAYWPGPDTLWQGVGTTLEAQLSRYEAVIHLRTPSENGGYENASNPLRIETAAEARAVDARIAEVWSQHPQLYTVQAAETFLHKAAEALEILRGLMPECCRAHIVPILQGLAPAR